MQKRSSKYFVKPSIAALSLNITNPRGAPLPPSISAHTFNQQNGFDPETVVSRHADGGIASRFKDPLWDYSALASAAERKDRIGFHNDHGLSIEMKTILLLVVHTPTSYQTKVNNLNTSKTALSYLANHCQAQNIRIKKLFNTKGGIGLVKLIKDGAPSYARVVIDIHNHLHFMCEEMGFKHGYKPLGRHVLTSLKEIAQEHNRNTKQNPVIPSRILMAIYHDTITEYESLLPTLEELLVMQAEIDVHPMVGLSLHGQKHEASRHCGTSFNKLKVAYPTNYDLAKKYPLAREYLNKNFSTRQKSNKPQDSDFEIVYLRGSVLDAICHIQRLCGDMIIMFTGMRPAEVNTLPYFGSQETRVDGVKYWLIYGFAAKKKTEVPPFELWVTNEYGYRAFQTAKRIADLFYKRNNRRPVKTTPDKGMTPELSPLYLRDNNGIYRRNTGNPKETSARLNSYVINQDDFTELKMIDPHRKWEGEPEFAIGQPFPVAFKLFRRSIAFFASASGVRLVDMKNQFHHLFESQTFYYGQGSGRANPFLKNKDSYASYFNQVKHEAQAVSFINDVINFDGKLFGASAAYAEKHEVFYSTIRNEDRDETIKRFERGELSYRETSVGGCKTLSPCKQKALGSITACLTCIDGDIKPVKLAQAIKDQEALVNSRNPERLEWRTEIQELITMLDYVIKNTGKAMESLDRRKDEYKQHSKWNKEFKQMLKHYQKIIDDNQRDT
jgi:hypothetical protein